MSEILPADEAAELAEAERIIEDGYTTFLKVGLALARIRDSRLYRGTDGTFESYCEKRWGLTRTRAYELMNAAGISAAMSEISNIAPETESQAKELRGLDRDTAVAVVKRAAESGDRLTAASIRAAREEIAPRPAKVTTTTTEKVERTVDLDTGEIVNDLADTLAQRDGDYAAAAQDSPGDGPSRYADPPPGETTPRPEPMPSAPPSLKSLFLRGLEKTGAHLLALPAADVGELVDEVSVIQLDRMRKWLDEATEAYRRRQRGQFSVINGGK